MRRLLRAICSYTAWVSVLSVRLELDLHRLGVAGLGVEELAGLEVEAVGDPMPTAPPTRHTTRMHGSEEGPMPPRPSASDWVAQAPGGAAAWR